MFVPDSTECIIYCIECIYSRSVTGIVFLYLFSVVVLGLNRFCVVDCFSSSEVTLNYRCELCIEKLKARSLLPGKKGRKEKRFDRKPNAKITHYVILCNSCYICSDCDDHDGLPTIVSVRTIITGRHTRSGYDSPENSREIPVPANLSPSPCHAVVTAVSPCCRSTPTMLRTSSGLSVSSVAMHNSIMLCCSRRSAGWHRLIDLMRVLQS